MYPVTLRRVKFRNPEDRKVLTLLTNHFDLPALTIAELYEAHWKIELFFKCINQHLRITCLFGHTINAAKTQIWIYYKCVYTDFNHSKRLDLAHLNLYNISQLSGKYSRILRRFNELGNP